MSPKIIEPIVMARTAAEAADFAAALGDSFERLGFAIVAGHELDPALIEATMADARALFALPAEVKNRYRVAGGAGQRGYTPFAIETAKNAVAADLKEFWHVGREAGRGPAFDNVWPDELRAFRRHALALYGAFESLGARLLGAIGRYLGLDDGLLEAAVAEGDSILRLLHYPPAEFAGPGLRAGPHEDINAITLLLGAEEAGLELLTREGDWLAVNAPPGAVVVNIGDMLARLTNDVLPSTTHRVVNPAPERRGVARYSAPFFVHFRPDFLIRTLAGCAGPDRPDRYPSPITAGDYLAERLREIRLA